MAEENKSVFPKDVQDTIADLKKQGFNDQNILQLINSNNNLKQQLLDTGKINNKTLQALIENNKTLKDLKNALKENTEESKSKKTSNSDPARFNSIREILAGDTKKGINDFIKTLNLGSTKVGKIFEDFKTKHAGIFAAIIDGYKIADKMMKDQAKRNESLYALRGENRGGFWNLEAHKIEAASQVGLAKYGYNKEDARKYLMDLSRMYNTRDMSDASIVSRAETHGAWEKYLGMQGVSQETARGLLEGLYKREGISDETVNKRVFDNFQKQMRRSGMSAENFSKAVLEMERSGRALGETFSSAASKVAKHGKAVESGMVSWENINTYRNSLVNAQTGTLAGLATEMAYAGKLPSDMVNLVGQPLQLAGVMRARMSGKSGESLARSLEEKIREEAANQGFSRKEEMGEYFRLRYANMGFSLSKAQYEALGRGETLTTGKYGSLTSEAEKQDKLSQAAAQAYADTSSISENVGQILSVLKSSVSYSAHRSFKEGLTKAEEAIDPNASMAKNIPIYLVGATYESIKAFANFWVSK